MQIILTEEEYTTLKYQADTATYYMKETERLKQLLAELQDKYTKLLVHGVVASNEHLKSTLKQGQ